MGRASTKSNKNRYQLVREELGLSREKASELLEAVTPAAKYRRPSLCNYYCSNQCPIGQAYVPEIEMKELSAIVLEMLASLNCVSREKERLIEITADGKIEGDEIDDFIRIQEELEKISITVETLQLWAEKMLVNGIIDPEAYRARKQK